MVQKDYRIIRSSHSRRFLIRDDIASGKVLANMIKYNIGEQIKEFIDAGKLIIGICNGFRHGKNGIIASV